MHVHCTRYTAGNIWIYVGEFMSFTGSGVIVLRTTFKFHFHTNSLINLLTDSFSQSLMQNCRWYRCSCNSSHIQSARLKTQQLWLSPPLSISNQTSCLKGNRTTGGVFTNERCTSAVLHAMIKTRVLQTWETVQLLQERERAGLEILLEITSMNVYSQN